MALPPVPCELPERACPGPIEAHGFWLWRDSTPQLEVRFVGRGPAWEGSTLLACLGESPRLEAAWVKQVHSARVREAAAGDCGEGDALWTADPDLAVLVVTADCVPVLLGGARAGAGAVAAVHAGWRGIAAGVVGATVEALPLSPGRLTAWIGPAIGPCCYEVGEEVAREVCAAAGADFRQPGAGARPHLDLGAAVAAQLTRTGIEDVRRVDACTRCAADRLASYRLDGTAAGRNAALIWRVSDRRA